MKNNETKKIIEIYSNKYNEFYQKIKDIEKQNDKYIFDTLGNSFHFFNQELFQFSLDIDGVEFDEKLQLTVVTSYIFIDFQNKSIIANNFPSLIKIINELEDFHDGMGLDFNTNGMSFGIGRNTHCEEILEMNGICFVFDNIEEFQTYIKNMIKVFDYFPDFIKEIEDYIEKQIFITIFDTGIKELNSNGGRKQEILFKTIDNSKLFKIVHLSESHESQSYSTLYIKDLSGWTVLQSLNPKRDFDIDISYSKAYKIDTFEPINTVLFDIAKNVSEIS